MRAPSFEARAELKWAETLARAGADPADIRTQAERARARAAEVGMPGIEAQAGAMLVPAEPG